MTLNERQEQLADKRRKSGEHSGEALYCYRCEHQYFVKYCKLQPKEQDAQCACALAYIKMTQWLEEE